MGEDRRGNDREPRREEYHRLKEKAKESYKSVKDVAESRKKERSRSQETNNGGGGDSFWDSKWEGMQLDEKLRKAEYKGRYYLNTNKRFEDATGDKGKGSPSLSPSPERKDKSKEVEKEKKKNSDSESDTEEFKRLKEMKKVQNFEVKGDGMVEGPIVDSSNFEYDPVTRMYRKKDGLVELETRRQGLGKDDDSKEGEKDKEKDSKDVDKEKDESKEAESGDKEKKPSSKEDIMDELVKEIEELENEVDNKDEDDTTIGTAVDWGSSALTEILTEKEKEEKKKRKEEEKRRKEEEKKKKKMNLKRQS